MTMTTRLIVGCGNPGLEYENTRHNLGFKCLDYIAEQYNCPLNIEKKKSMFGKKELFEKELILLKPQTFIIHSGEAVLYIASFLKINIHDILVIYDELDLPFGEIKISMANEQDVSHSAIVSLKNSLSNDSFVTCAVGIGLLPDGKQKDDFYLEEFLNQEVKQLPRIYDKVKENIDQFISD